MSLTEFTKKIVLDFTDKGTLKKLADDFKNDVGKGLINTFKTAGKILADNISSSITSAFKSAITEMKSMLEFSQLSNKDTRDLAFQYGFSANEAYGYTKALDLVGLKDMEDLYYANEQELRQFRDAFEKYSNKYAELYDSGFFETMQEYQYEMEDFKLEMQTEIIKFFMDNKDTIKAGMIAIMEIAKTLLNILSWVVKLAGGSSDRVLSDSEILNQYNQTTNRNNSVSINNNFNGIGEGDEAELANMGNVTYKQVIQALTGGNF